MGVADKSEAKIDTGSRKKWGKINRNSRKLNQSINGGSRQKWGKKTEIDAN